MLRWRGGFLGVLSVEWDSIGSVLTSILFQSVMFLGVVGFLSGPMVFVDSFVDFFPTSWPRLWRGHS